MKILIVYVYMNNTLHASGEISYAPSVSEGLPARHYGDSRYPLLVSPLPPPYWPCPLIWHRLCGKTKRRRSIELPRWTF